MHLHGVFFRVHARGTALTDTTYALPDERLAVTELLLAGTSRSLSWNAERAGNWVKGSRTAAVPPRSPRASASLRLHVTERSLAPGAPAFAYVLERDGRSPAGDSLEAPESTLVLRQGEPTQITVLNHTSHGTAVHWHGMEIESFYDGAAGWSGSGARTAPLIAPGDSFVVRITPPRAGTFIYHTHARERAQLSGGLYGALLVLPRGATRDTTDRLIVLADSTAADFILRTPPSLIKGSTRPEPLELTVGTSHQLRFIGISAVSQRVVRLLHDTVLVAWTPLAKDGADLPRHQLRSERATRTFSAGETFDLAFTPTDTGTLTLQVTSLSRAPIVTSVAIRVRARR